MKIGLFDSRAADGATLDTLIASAAAAHDGGFASWWVPQIFGYEALAALAVVGHAVPDIALGTAVVPTYPRHPMTMAQLALTVQAAAQNRLTLGIGLSHQIVIETLLGMSYERPARHMREYLDVLMPLLSDRKVSAHGETISTMAELSFPDEVTAPDVVVAALGPAMLKLAGSRTAGTVTWMTGPKTLQSHIVPSITAAASEAGRPAPRVVCCLPVLVVDDEAAGREVCGQAFAMYGTLPSYRAMLDREGAAGPADVAIIGSEVQVAEQIRALADIGVTEFVAVTFAKPGGAEAQRTIELLRAIAADTVD